MSAKPSTSTTVTVLGSGTSSGVPLLGCTCKVCRSRDPKNQRLRASVWVETQGKSLLIDTSTDLRQQALTHRIERVDAILFTHPHSDHVSGVDDVRAWNFIQQSRIPAYGNHWTHKDLITRFPYLFAPNAMPPEGGAIAQIDLHQIDPVDQVFEPLPGIKVQPLPVQHGSQEVLGFRFGTFAYLTDCSYIPAQTLRLMEGLDALILDCVRIKPHRTHLNFDGAIEVVNQVRPGKTYLTHLGHDFDQQEWDRKLPRGVRLAYDGLRLKINEPTKRRQRA